MKRGDAGNAGPDAADRPRLEADGHLPLEGVRVVAWEQAVAGPLATRHLADLGADVIKIENPAGGDLARAYDSSINGMSAHFVWLNRGKRSVALDLKATSGLRALLDLLAVADVFLHNQGPGVAQRLGLDERELRRLNPRLIICSISGYSPGTPEAGRKAYDMIVQGEMGLMALTGTPEEPMRAGLPAADIAAGMYALCQILARLYDRRSSGTGAVVNVSLVDSLLEWMIPELLTTVYTGRPPQRAGARHVSIAPYGMYAAMGGERLNLAVQNDGQWQRLCCEVLRRPDLVGDHRFATNESRARNRQELEPIIEDVFSRLSADELQDLLAVADVPHGRVRELDAVCARPPLSAADRWISVRSPAGDVRVPRSPLDDPGRSGETMRIPDLGEDTTEVLRSLAEERIWPPGRTRSGDAIG